MTPTPDLQAIRFLEAVRFSLDHERKYPARAMPWTADDMQQLLTLWDTQQTALCALVEQWRQDLADADAPLQPADMVGAGAARRQFLRVQVVGLSRALRELARLLTPEQS